MYKYPDCLLTTAFSSNSAAHVVPFSLIDPVYLSSICFSELLHRGPSWSLLLWRLQNQLHTSSAPCPLTLPSGSPKDRPATLQQKHTAALELTVRNHAVLGMFNALQATVSFTVMILLSASHVAQMEAETHATLDISVL